ncbi:transcription antitermination protein NusB [Candidatus Gromoviella agglomerans]|uniref:transcription antitermination protein NusB n=1 Tax=Candidatus Gromoviella agglomerans TaxID=2806609 RepID=UPI001E440925|nr:transcription antitermination protein NusB [Candidatus Gromoviella agglomerans]UFX98204.1 Transcription antitermination protein NusB [Candidatus Gromoviella agglomerans]
MQTQQNNEASKSRFSYTTKRYARLAFVQAIFQSHMTGQHMNDVKEFFLNSIIRREVDGIFIDASEKYFIKLVQSISDLQRFDNLISDKIERDAYRLDNVSLSILRAAIHEKYLIKVHSQVVISEYLEIAKSFFDESPKVKLINGVLDKIFNEITEVD